MRQEFIDSNKFLNEMQNMWRSFNNTPSEKFNETWSVILQSFNNQLDGKPGLHVCDSVCGSGKTLSAQVASSVLSGDWPDIGTIIVVRLTEQCVDVARSINEISLRLNNRLIARPMFSGKSLDGTSGVLTDDEILDTQVIVITHARYLSYVSGAKVDRFASWRKGKRKFRIVDESLDLVEKWNLTREDLKDLSDIFYKRSDYYDELQDKFGNHIRMFDEIMRYIGIKMRNTQTYEYPLIDVIKQHRVDGNDIFFSEMIEMIEESKPSDYDKRFRENEFESFITDGIEKIKALDRLIRRAIYASDDSGMKRYSTGSIVLPSKFESLCVLDATSNVDAVYSLFKQKEQIEIYSVDRNVRNFRNCNLNIRPESSGLGKQVTSKQSGNRIQKLMDWADMNFDSSDKVLFAGHKSMMEQLKKFLHDNPKEYQSDICWWNSIDGRNNWRDFNKLVIVSMPYLPKYYGPTTQIGIKEINPELECTESLNINDSALAVKMIQLMARIQTRRVINEYGDCPESDIYLLLPGEDIHPDIEDEACFESLTNELSQYLLKEIKNSMNGVTLKKWTSFNGFSKPSHNRKITVNDHFKSWLMTFAPGETKDKADFESSFNIDRNQMMSLNTSLSRSKSSVCKMMKSIGITKSTKRGRNGTTIFSKEI